MSRKIQMGCLVEESFHVEFAIMAEETDRPVASEMRRAMESHLEKHKQKKIVEAQIKKNEKP